MHLELSAEATYDPNLQKDNLDPQRSIMIATARQAKFARPIYDGFASGKLKTFSSRSFQFEKTTDAHRVQ
jgi:hypothetical protein